MTIRSTESDQSYKQKVATSFSKAAASYDEYALFQEQVLNELMALFNARAHDRWLDIGTGTGPGIQRMQAGQSDLQCVALDLSFSMLQQAQKRTEMLGAVCADAEALPFQSNVFDGVFSSLAIQWCLHPEALFKELHRVLKPGGTVLISTLLSGSMPEIGQAWQQVDGRSHHNHYSDLNSILQHCEAAGLELESAQQRKMTVHFDSVKAAVYSLKKVGASLIVDGSSVTSPSKWKAFESAYLQMSSQQGVPLSYEVALIRLMKVDNG